MSRVLFSSLLGLGLALMAGCSSPAADDGDATNASSDLTGDDAEVAALKKAVANVDQVHVILPSSIVAPAIDASTGAKSDDSSLFGIDWYQKWAGGKSADHDWNNGSDFGKRCAWASIARYEAIMASAPPELAALRTANPKWDGSFTSWNDDYGGKTADGKPAYGDAKSAEVKATGSGAVKWVSATATDGSCYLPTKAMVVGFAKSCKASLSSCGSL